jgi:hypothetical protein
MANKYLILLRKTRVRSVGSERFRAVRSGSEIGGRKILAVGAVPPPGIGVFGASNVGSKVHGIGPLTWCLRLHDPPLAYNDEGGA